MVNEFSSFARMPEPEFQRHDFKAILGRVIFAQGVAFPDIQFILDDETNQGELWISCDDRLITQALTNVLKNAGESISERVDQAGIDRPDGQINARLSVDENVMVLGISDNGRGWPVPDKHRLLEPYVTTRDTGTGLGLAIVKRIAEDHDGALFLKDRPDGRPGAYLEIVLPLGGEHLSEKTMNMSNEEDIIHEA